MTKLDQNFDLWTGTDKTLAFTVTGSDGAGLNVTGYTVEWRLFDEPNTASLLQLKTGGSGITIRTSTVSVALAASLTAGCNLSGTYYHELSACDTGGNADVLAVGYGRINRKG